MATVKKKKDETTKGLDIAAALSAVTKEKSISMDLVLDSLKDALASAAKKFLNNAIHVEVNVDREKGIIEAYTLQNVVEEVEDPEMEISLEEAKKIDAELEVGDEVVSELDIKDFGRSAIQTAKQIIMQRVREYEREKIFADYSERVGELVTGTVQQIDKGNILINLGRTEALLPFKEQIRRERYRQGDTIRGAIAEVKNSVKGPQVIISRTSPIFLERLFEIEVPEIFEKIVQIIKVVRAPGYRAKVAVTTNDSRVDPVGACVGMRGNRVQAIVRELSNERMDIINWTDEVNLLVRRVFSPAEVKRVLPVGEYKVVVIIQEDDLAQAIGKEGQNIKLASKLIDKEIDMFGDVEFDEMSEQQREEILTEEEFEEELDQQAEDEESEGIDSAVDVLDGEETTENVTAETEKEAHDTAEAEESEDEVDAPEEIAEEENEAADDGVAEEAETEEAETEETETEETGDSAEVEELKDEGDASEKTAEDNDEVADDGIVEAAVAKEKDELKKENG